MLHDDSCGLLEVHTDVQGLVQIEDVVVGQFLTPEAFRLGHCGSGCEGVLVECGRLVGVLSVPEVLYLLQWDREGVRESGDESLLHLRGDHRVVLRCHIECLCHEPLVEVGAEVACVGIHLLDDLRVLLGLGDHCDGLVVLCGRTDHAGAADVDVLDNVLEGYTLLEHRLLEWIQVDDDHVDGVDVLALDGRHVVGDVPACEDTRMDLGVERLDASVQHLGESRDVRYLDNLDVILFQKLVRAACGDQLHACGL